MEMIDFAGIVDRFCKHVLGDEEKETTLRLIVQSATEVCETIMHNFEPIEQDDFFSRTEAVILPSKD